MKTNKSLVSLAVAFGLTAFTTTTQAAGFQLAEYSATGLGRAYAGEAAMADNAGAQWRNPAMMTYLPGTQTSAGVIYVDPNVDIDGHINASGQQLPASSDDFAHDAFIPSFYLSHQLSERLFLGLALNTNYGMETELSNDFSGSHFGNEAMVKTMEANVNIAYKVTPAVSLGGGLRYVRGEGHFGATVPAQTELATQGILKQGTTLKYMEGDTDAWGWQAGAAWQINPNHRIGFAYKSEVKLDLEGHAEGIGFGLQNGQRLSGSMELPMPATAELASFHQLTDRLAMHASINWTDWSAFKKLEADLDVIGKQMVKEENWRDNYRFAIGATYQLDSKLALRTGVAYDTSAVSDKNRTITIPETDRTWLSVGASYDVTKNFNLDAGFTYIIAKDADIVESRGYPSDDAAQDVGGQFVGEISGSVWLVGVQANYRF